MSKLLRLPLKSTEDELYELCPITATMLIASGYEHDLYDQFSYPIENDQIRFYNLSKKEIEDILDQAPKMYGLIVDSLEILFERHKDKVSKYFGEIFNEAKYKNFLDYAAWTYENDHVALYGRFDIPYDYENGKIKGFYEFNGDTPVMIHESVYVQDLFSRKIGQPDSQVNLHYEYMKGFISNHLKKEKVKGVGVFADMAYIEDSLTAEYFFELFHSEFGQDKTVIGQISDLGFDDCS
ncbi:glutathionylspermidine synthase family protein, partial [Vibrio parahaemolyticus]